MGEEPLGRAVALRASASESATRVSAPRADEWPWPEPTAADDELLGVVEAAVDLLVEDDECEADRCDEDVLGDRVAVALVGDEPAAGWRAPDPLDDALSLEWTPGDAVVRGLDECAGAGVTAAGRTGRNRGADLVPVAALSANDQPSKPPAATTWLLTPDWLYVQLPPFRADQYDQYAEAGGVSMHGSLYPGEPLTERSWLGPGLPYSRQMKASPHRRTPS